MATAAVTHSAPWVLLVSGDIDPSYGPGIALWAVAFTLLQFGCRAWFRQSELLRTQPRKPKPGSPEEDALLLDFAVDVASTVHATFVAVAGTVVMYHLTLACGPPAGMVASCPDVAQGGGWVLALWRFSVQASIGYFLADLALFCVPRRDVAVAVHHCVMIAAYVPGGSAPIMGLAMPPGSTLLFVWIGAAAYMCEYATIFLNIRAMLRRHVMREHTVWYAVNSGLLILSYVLLRVCWFPVLFYQVYSARHELVVPGLGHPAYYYGCLAALGLLWLMSVIYTAILLKRGLRGLLVYSAPAAGAQKLKPS